MAPDVFTTFIETPKEKGVRASCAPPLSLNELEARNLEDAPIRLLRSRAGDACPAPPPKRFSRTVWRGLVRRAVARDRDMCCD
jgi:hypothetical protein